MKWSCRINGRRVETEVRPGDNLLGRLRKSGCWSPKYGCDTGDCGACLVLVDGEPRLSCLSLAYQTQEADITTVESLGAPDRLGPLQEAFLEHGAAQCGYCTPAMLLAAHHLLQHNATPTEVEVRQALAGILCRCTGYQKPVDAILACSRQGQAGLETES